jgi:adenosylcobyric acid synthase
VLGLCGGYQMLGRLVRDPHGVEGTAGETAGLGLLDVETEIGSTKTLQPVSGTDTISGALLQGYEMHMGVTVGADCARPFAVIDGKPDGACSSDGRVAGSYLHGLIAADDFRHAYLARLGVQASLTDYDGLVEETLDTLADHLERHLDCDSILAVARARAEVRLAR